MRIKVHREYILGKFQESLFATFIGLCAGLGAALLDFLIELFHKVSFNGGLAYFHLLFLVLYQFAAASVEVRVTIPGLVLSLKFLKENLFVPLFLWFAKYFGIALSLSVVPLGREGPAMFLGTGLGEYIATLFKVPKGQLNYWGTIGAAAFVGAFLKTPLGATFYVFENRFGKVLNIDFVIDALTSSTVSYTVYAYLRGFHPLIALHGHFYWNLYDLLPAFFLGVFSAVSTFLFFAIWEIFKLLAGLVPNSYRPLAIFPLLLFLFAVAYNHETIHLLNLSVNYQPINEVSSAIYPIEVLLGTILLEMLFISLLLSFGFPGGIILPLIFIGASLGNIVAHVSPDKLPTFVLTGAAAMISAAMNVPITAVIMISEMSHRTLIIPEMVGVLTAYFLAKSVKLLRV